VARRLVSLTWTGIRGRYMVRSRMDGAIMTGIEQIYIFAIGMLLGAMIFCFGYAVGRFLK